MPIATLSIDLEAKLARLEQGLDKAYRLNEQTAAKIDARWRSLSAGASVLGSAIASAFSVTAIVAFTRSTADAIDALNDSADATGATIENLSALEDVARRNGGTLDDVTSIVVKFNSVLKEADGKNGVSRALQAIGLDAAELRKLDPAEALRLTAVAISQYADDGDKARLVQELFGKSVKDAAPFLKDLAEAGRLNGTVTTEQAQAAEQFNKQLAALQTTAGNFTRELLSEAIPALNSYLEKVGRIGKNIDIKYAEGDAVQKAQQLARLTESIAGLQVLAAKDPGQADRYAARIAELRAGLPAVSKAAADANEKLKALLGPGETTPNAGGGRGFVNPPVVKPSVGGLPVTPIGGKPTSSAVDLSIPQDLQDVLARLQSTDDAKLARLNAELSRMAELVFGGSQDPRLAQAMEAARMEMDALVSKRNKASDPFGPDIDPAELERRNQAQRDFNALIEALPSTQIERVRNMQAGLNQAYSEGRVNAVQYAEATKLLDEDLKALQGTGIDVGKTIEQALGSSVEAALQGNFDGIAQMWEQMLLEMVAKAASADLQNALFGTGKGGNLASLGSAFLSFFGVPGFAGGGDHAGGARIVGERGPELEFTGPSRIVNASRTRDMLKGGGGRPQVIIQVAAGVGRAEVYEAVQRGYQAAQADARALFRQQARGG